MKILNRLNTLSVHLLTLAGAVAVASAVINIITALTMFAVDKLDEAPKNPECYEF